MRMVGATLGALLLLCVFITLNCYSYPSAHSTLIVDADMTSVVTKPRGRDAHHINPKEIDHTIVGEGSTTVSSDRWNA